jgi:hypothetical protein
MTKKKYSKKNLSTILEESDGLDEQKFNRFFNIKKLSDVTGINRDKIYNNLRGDYHSIKEEDRRKMVEVLKPNVVTMFEWLGYEVIFKKLENEKIVSGS